MLPSTGPVFVSYSHKDKKWLQDLRTMLAPLVRDGVVDVWWDGAIKPSQRWRDEIEAALTSARVAVLLVSPHFLASDFIVDEELSYLLDAARQHRVEIFWALLAPCLYERTPLQDLQALHDLEQPLNALRGAARGKALKAICGARSQTLETSGPQQNCAIGPAHDAAGGAPRAPGPRPRGRQGGR